MAPWEWLWKLIFFLTKVHKEMVSVTKIGDGCGCNDRQDGACGGTRVCIKSICSGTPANPGYSGGALQDLGNVHLWWVYSQTALPLWLPEPMKLVMLAERSRVGHAGFFFPFRTYNGVHATPAESKPHIICDDCCLAHIPTNFNGSATSFATHCGFITKSQPIVGHRNLVAGFSWNGSRPKRRYDETVTRCTHVLLLVCNVITRGSWRNSVSQRNTQQIPSKPSILPLGRLVVEALRKVSRCPWWRWSRLSSLPWCCHAQVRKPSCWAVALEAFFTLNL